MPTAPAPPAVADLLAQAAHRYGTPAYVYDLARVRARVAHLAGILPAGVDVRYSVKANPHPAICQVIAGTGLEAEVSSPGEFATAIDAGFPPAKIMVSGPYKAPDLLHRLAGLPEVLISVDSLSELAQLAAPDQPRRRVVLRLRPDYPLPGEMCVGPDSRFGIPLSDIDTAIGPLRAGPVSCAGFHVYGGSQILDPDHAARHLDHAHDLTMRAAKHLDLTPDVLNLGGGFGVPYTGHDTDLDLGPAETTLHALASRDQQTRLILELGRYLVADAGWYLTSVVHQQTYANRSAVVVDGGIHHRPDLCGLDLAQRGAPPLLLGPPRPGTAPTAVLGCLCLPWDVLAHAAELPALQVGDVLAFPTAGAYGLSAAPTGFLGHRLPAEITLDAGALTLLPPPQPAAQTAGVS